MDSLYLGRSFRAQKQVVSCHLIRWTGVVAAVTEPRFLDLEQACLQATTGNVIWRQMGFGADNEGVIRPCKGTGQADATRRRKDCGILPMAVTVRRPKA